MRRDVPALVREAKAFLRSEDPSPAEALLDEAWSRVEEIEDLKSRAEAVHHIAAGFRQLDLLAQSEPAARLAIQLEEDLGRTMLVGNHLMFLVMLLRDTGRSTEALPLAQRALDCYISELGQDHREVGYVASVLRSVERAASEEGSASAE